MPENHKNKKERKYLSEKDFAVITMLGYEAMVELDLLEKELERGKSLIPSLYNHSDYKRKKKIN